MRRKASVPLAFAVSLVLLAALVSACSSGTAVATPTNTLASRATAAPSAAVDAAATAAAGPVPSTTVGPETTGPPVGDDGVSAGEVVAAIASRTPVPTPTPGVVADKVDEITVLVGLTGRTFLGLPARDWIDVVISLVIAMVGYLLALLAVRVFLAVVKRGVRHTSSEFDDAFVEAIGQEIKWLVMVLVLRYALLRLDLWSDRLRILIADALFVLGLGIVVMMALKVINFAAWWYRDHLDPDVDKTRLQPIILLLQRSGSVVVLIIGVSVGVSHFGIQITVLAAALILGTLVILLGARYVISDAFSGLLILVDQPFRVGDVIKIEDLNRWGEVVDIGTRTTHIRTSDERFAIVPNSRIGASQVINYTFPDPEYRVHTDIWVAYGSDFDRVRRVAHDAVRGIDGVLPDQPVDVLFHEYGVTARVMRVRWWIDDMHEEKRITDRVHEALEIAFEKAEIEMPVTTRELIVRNDSEAVEYLS